MNLAAAFTTSAERNAGRPAVFWGEQTCSYEMLLRKTRHLAGHLQHDLGVKPGDRVGLWLKNCPEFVPTLFGILSSGAVAVPINNFLKTEEVNYILEDAGIDVLITDAELGSHDRSLAVSRPQLRLFRVEEFPKAAGQGISHPKV